jgi:CDP-glycerol glycerophosphotransferase
MIKHYGNAFTYVWAVNKANMLPPEYSEIKTVKFLSFSYFIHALSAGYVIYNSMVKCYLPFRKKQIIVNTWHGGGAYKKMGLDAEPYQKDYMSMKVAREKTARMVTHIISACEKFTAVSSKVWTVSREKYMSIGMPRNDIFFTKVDSINKKTKSNLKLDVNKKIVMYAPTFRGHYRNADPIAFSLNLTYLKQALKDKFSSDFIILYRSHIYDRSEFTIASKDAIIVSDYPDMQELLCISDILITDYSSSIWDFSFTFKPCFIYAPDLFKYNKITDFYTPIEEWPFPLAETNEKLVKNIIDFDKDVYIKAVKKHHSDLGSYENGTACEQFFKVLFKNQ